MKILIIDDEQSILSSLEKQFKKLKWTSISADNYKKARKILFDQKFDVIVCDHHLSPGEGEQGLDLIREAREKGITTPILVITGHDSDEITPWDALDVGSDDFLKKPYHPAEIVARIKAINRRSFACKNNSTNTISYDEVSLDLTSKKVFVDKKEIHLSNTLFLILKKLLEQAEGFLSYEDLIKYLWGEAALLEKESSNTLRVHISYLRNSLGGKYGKYIKTVHGRGYIWERVEN